jgi:phage protein D
MIAEVVSIVLEGVPRDDLVPDVVEIEVEEDVDVADVFSVRLALTTRSDGSWPYVDDPDLAPWRQLRIDAGYPGAVETIVDGFITNLEMLLGSQGEGHLELSGMDRSAALDVADKQLAWANKADSDIAREIFSAYGLQADVEPTAAVHAEATSTVLQSETDIRFLRRLAARNGFECRVRGETASFRAPNLQEPPQKPLAVAFGQETNLVDLTVRVDATPPDVAEIRRVDPIEKREETKALTETPRRLLGRTPLARLRGTQPAADVLVRRHAAISIADMEARLSGAYVSADRFVVADGQVDPRAYRAVLRSGRLVTIKGAGEAFSGLYYVRRVRHTFTTEGYTQSFSAHRNALGLVGDERFTATPLGVV